MTQNSDPARHLPNIRDIGAESAFLRGVGERVRAARGHRGLSRRALADASGVSQRYLAQLEGGDGNVSIALLNRIASALGRRTGWFLGEAGVLDDDDDDIGALFSRASEEQRQRVLEILRPGNDGQKADRVALIGLRGAGKSTLGRRSAAVLGIPFVELNAEIETVSGMPVNELIALYGQEGYRRLERQVVERVAAEHARLVLAVAGGIVSEPETYAFLLAHFRTIWLRARPEEHMARVLKQGDTRPMAGNPKAMDDLRSILTSREALYARADRQVDTSGRALEQSLSEVLAVIRKDAK